MAAGPPLVSVVIPTHNRWPMIAEAVQSVLTQTFGDFELIVVDDGSIDNTARLLSSCDSRLQVLSQPHTGVAAARNAGVARSRGKYIAFLDSDDLWSPAKLAIQADFMEHNPEMHICQTEEIWIRRGVRVNPKARHRKPSGDIFQRSLELCLVSPSAVMMTKELFYLAGGFDESFPVCEDYDLWLRIAVAHPVFLIESPLVTKRGGHVDQLSRSTWGIDRFRVLAIAKLLRAGLVGEKRQWALDSIRQKISILAAGAAKRGKLDQARKFEALLSEV
jgi:glycosyltransferase involved in cell wall biosynthesis